MAPYFGTKVKLFYKSADLAQSQDKASSDKLLSSKASARKKIDEDKAKGKDDKWYDRIFVGFKIEVLFLYTEDDGTTYLDWCDGVVVSIVNGKTNNVRIRWNKDILRAGDPRESNQKLLETKWNPEVALKGKGGLEREFKG